MENKALIPEEDQQALETYTVGIIRLENNMAVLLKTFGKLTKEFAGPIKSLNEFNKSVDESKKAEEGLKNARTEEQRLQQEGLTLTKRVIQTNSDQVKAVQKVSKEIVEQSKATSALIAKTEAYRQKLAQVQKEAQNREGLTFIDESGNYDLTKTQAQYAEQTGRVNELQREANMLMQEGALSAGQYAMEIDSLERAQQRINENLENAQYKQVHKEYLENSDALKGVASATDEVDASQAKLIDTSAKLNAAIEAESESTEGLRDILDKVLGSREENVALLNQYQVELNKVRSEQKQLTKDEAEGTLKVKDLASAQEALLSRELELKERISDVSQVLKIQTKEMVTLDGTSQRSAKSLELLRVAARKIFEDQQDTPAYQMVIHNIDELDTKLKDFDASIGNHQRNVGNYKDGILDANRALSLIDPSLGRIVTKVRGISGVKNVWQNVNDSLVKSLNITSKTANTLQLSIVGLVGAGIYLAIKAFQQWMKSTEQLNKLQTEFIGTIIQEQTQVKILFDNLRNATEGTQEYEAAKKSVIDSYGKYLEGQSAEISNLRDIKAAQILVTEAVVRHARETAYATAQSSLVTDYAEKTSRAWNSVYDALSNTGVEIEGFTTEGAIRELERLISASEGIMTPELREFTNRLSVNVWGNNEVFTRQFTDAVRGLVKADTELQKGIERVNVLYDDYGKSTGAATEEVKSLIKVQEEQLEQARKLPETTEQEIVVKNQKIKAIETEIARLRSLGVETEKTSKVQKVSIDKERKAASDYALFLIRQEAETAKNITSGQREAFEDRLGALDVYLKKQEESIVTAAQNQVDTLEGTEEQTRYQRAFIWAKAEAEINKIAQEGVKIRETIIKDASKEYADRMAANITQATTAISTAEQDNILKIEQLYSKGKIHAADYQRQITEITRKAALDRFDAEMEILTAELAATIDNEEQFAEISKKIDDNRLKYAQEVSKQLIADERKAAKERENIERSLAEVRKELLADVGNFAAAIADRWTRSELTRLDEESERNEEFTNKEIERIERLEDSGAISKEQAQARKDLVDQQALEKEEAVEAKRKEIEKRAAIANISFQTIKILAEMASAIFQIRAQAAILAANPITAALAPIALGQIPFLRLSAATQIATLALSELPQYAQGTPAQGHNGGYAIMGDGGRAEMALLPDGRIWKSPATDTIVDLPKGTHVFPDFNKAMLNLGFEPITVPADKAKPVDIDVRGMIAASNGTTAEIKKMRQSMDTARSTTRFDNIVNVMSKLTKNIS